MKKRRLNGMMALASLFIMNMDLNAQAASRHDFSIQQCVEFAAKNNTAVKNALLNIKIQEQTNRAITAGALPSITINAGTTDYLDIPTTLLPGEIVGQPPGTYVPVKFGTKYTANAGIQLQQTLFDGQVFIGLQARTTSIEYQKKNAEVTEEAIKVNIYKIYYQLVTSKTQIDLLDANIKHRR